MSVSEAQQTIAKVWFFGSGVAIIALITQSLFGYWGDKVSDAWSWFLPTILPTLTLIVSSVVADARKQRRSEMQIEQFPYMIALWLSVFYFICVFISVLAGNFTKYAPLELMKISGLWLGPLQGLLSALIALFFVKQSSS